MVRRASGVRPCLSLGTPVASKKQRLAKTKYTWYDAAQMSSKSVLIMLKIASDGYRIEHGYKNIVLSKHRRFGWISYRTSLALHLLASPFFLRRYILNEIIDESITSTENLSSGFFVFRYRTHLGSRSLYLTLSNNKAQEKMSFNRHVYDTYEYCTGENVASLSFIFRHLPEDTNKKSNNNNNNSAFQQQQWIDYIMFILKGRPSEREKAPKQYDKYGMGHRMQSG